MHDIVLFGFFYRTRNCFGIMKSNSRSLMVCVKPRWFDTPGLVVHSDVPKFDGVVMFPPKAWWFYKKNRKREKKCFSYSEFIGTNKRHNEFVLAQNTYESEFNQN